MILDVEVNGRTRTVSVERVASHDSRFHVTLDGQTRVVDARSVDSSTLSLILLHAGGASHDVGLFETRRPGELMVRLRDGALRAVVNGGRSRRGAADAVAGLSGEQRIVAPMPGKVVRVLVSAGAEVAAHQGLVVVEAMKMENELSSPKTGRVKEIAVREGMAVEAGRLLVVVE